MPFTKNQSEDRAELRDLVYGWGKNVIRRTFGEAGPGLERDFDSIESLAVDLAQTLTSLSDILNGKRRISPRVRAKFAECFGVSASFFA